MRPLLAATLVALLLAGCGEDTKKPGGEPLETNRTFVETSPAKTAQVGNLDLDDPATREKITAEAIDWDQLFKFNKVVDGNGDVVYRPIDSSTDGRGHPKDYIPGDSEKPPTFEIPVIIPCEACKKEVSKEGGACPNCSHPIANSLRAYKEDLSKDEGSRYIALNEEAPYTGWVKSFSIDKDDGIKQLQLNQLKNGRLNGPSITWINGIKLMEVNLERDKVMTVITWKPNGEKCPHTKVLNGNGVAIMYNLEGKEIRRLTFRDGKEVDPVSTDEVPNWLDNPNYQRALVDLKLGRKEDAMDRFLKVLEASPKSAQSHLELGRLLLAVENRRDPRQAIHHFRQFLELKPDSREAKMVKQLISTAERKIDLEKIIAEAIENDELEWRWRGDNEGEKPQYAPDEQNPYSGWTKKMHDNGRIEMLLQYKDGKIDGLQTRWYSNGQKKKACTYKDGKLMSIVAWKINGDKCPHTNVVNGNGVMVEYYDDGTDYRRLTFKDGEPVTE